MGQGVQVLVKAGEGYGHGIGELFLGV